MPTLKKVVALASVDASQSELGTRIDVEWTVEAQRSRVPATVVELPFFNPERRPRRWLGFSGSLASGAEIH